MATLKDRRAEMMLPLGELQRLYKFDFARGEIYHRRTGRRVDKIYLSALPRHPHARYKQVTVSLNGGFVRVYAHRLIWAMAHGRWPAAGMDIDHLNADIHDNRPENLCEVTDAENTRRGRIKRFVYLLHAVP